MSRVFRGKFIQQLQAAYRKGEIKLHGSLASLKDGNKFEQLANSSVKNDWVVYCKRPFGGPRQVLKYLARYTHRVAISNSRLVDYEEGSVRFRWKDYRNGSQPKTMQLDGVEFMRRFMLHVLPAGFVRIRHHGFLANRNRSENLARCRKLLGVSETSIPTTEAQEGLTETEGSALCPACKSGRLQASKVGALSGFSTRRTLSLFETGMGFQDSS